MNKAGRDLAAEFFGDSPEIVDESCENLQLQVAPISNTTTPTTVAHKRRAKELHRQAVAQTCDLFDTLNAIREEKAFLSLGHSSFESYCKALKKEADYLSIDLSTFYRILAHREVKGILQDAGVIPSGLTQQQSAELNTLPANLIVETFQRAHEIAREVEPSGYEAKYHTYGKALTTGVRRAVAEQTAAIVGNDPDPYEDPRPLGTHVRQSVTAIEEKTGQKEILLPFAKLERFADADVLFVHGDDGRQRYVIAVQVRDILKAVGK